MKGPDAHPSYSRLRRARLSPRKRKEYASRFLRSEVGAVFSSRPGCADGTVAGVSAARSLQHDFNLFLCFWLVGWFLGELAASCAILYMLGGREVVLANSERLSCTTEIFGLGFAKSYLVREMRDSRFQPASGVGKGRRASRIAFDYGANTIPFGADIEEAEATELISRIRQRLPSSKLRQRQRLGSSSGSPGSHGTRISRVKIEVPIWPIFNAERP
jgi:hypothetical protein